MRTLAIGDIHGCNTALELLLGEVRPGPADQMVFLGDYVDRGPGTRQVIDRLLAQSNLNDCAFLRGNHETMMLDSRADPHCCESWMNACGGAATLRSYGVAPDSDWVKGIPAAHWKFLESTIPYFETATNIFVHGGLDPQLDMAEQPDELLQWETFFTMRPHKSGKRVICGHTAQSSASVKDLGFAACIDTGPAYGGWLTCLDVTAGKYWQANELGDVRTGQL